MYIFIIESVCLHCQLFEITSVGARDPKGYIKRHSLKSFIKPPKVGSTLNVQALKRVT